MSYIFKVANQSTYLYFGIGTRINVTCEKKRDSICQKSFSQEGEFCIAHIGHCYL